MESLFKVQFGPYSKEESVVFYNIRVHYHTEGNSSGGSKMASQEHSFHINDRYSNMRKLWEDIRKTANNPDRIPDFPPKKWFGSKSKEFLDQRKCALEIFFNTLFESSDKNVTSHIMKYFKSLAKNR